MSNPRLVYFPRREASPEGEISALVAVYRYLSDCHDKKAIEADIYKGRVEAECVGGMPDTRSIGNEGSKHDG